MEGRIVNFRLGGKRQYSNQVLILIEEAIKDPNIPLGKKVIVKDKYNNIYTGKIIKRHGKGKTYIAIFKPNIPPIALGNKVEILVDDIS